MHAWKLYLLRLVITIIVGSITSLIVLVIIFLVFCLILALFCGEVTLGLTLQAHPQEAITRVTDSWLVMAKEMLVLGMFGLAMLGGTSTSLFITLRLGAMRVLLACLVLWVCCRYAADSLTLWLTTHFFRRLPLHLTFKEQGRIVDNLVKQAVHNQVNTTLYYRNIHQPHRQITVAGDVMGF